MSNIIFCVIALTMIITGTMVIITKNPIHSVLYLITVFMNATILIILLGVEFLGLILLIVYVGAIAILFLFVVMMLNIKLVELNENITRYIPIGIIIGFALLVELIIALQLPLTNALQLETNFGLKEWTSQVISMPSNGINTIGAVLYTQYYQWFILSGFILLVAMIGAIVLTINQRTGIKRQNLYSQLHASNNIAKMVETT